MKKKFAIGFLSTINSPLLPLFLKSIIEDEKFKNVVVICDSKKTSDKNLRIWNKRTGGLLGQVNNFDYKNYKVDNKALPFYFVKNHNHNKTLQIIKALSLDVLVNVGTPRKIKKELINSVRHGIINVHPGSLPRYRGCCAVEWAIYNNDKITNTSHFINEYYDSGNIILFKSYKFTTNSTYHSIRAKVYKEGSVLAAKTLKHIYKTRILPNDGNLQNEKIAKYWNVIPDAKLAEVIKRLKKGKYKYQI